jgi:hypothetical protein
MTSPVMILAYFRRCRTRKSLTRKDDLPAILVGQSRIREETRDLFLYNV